MSLEYSFGWSTSRRMCSASWFVSKSKCNHKACVHAVVLGLRRFFDGEK